MKGINRITAGVGALAAIGGCASDRQNTKPNIVFFFADDIGAECFGCYGGVEYETPCIDSLAKAGIQYMNMNAQPLSSPSRVQVMTGLYNDRNYVAFGYMNKDELPLKIAIFAQKTYLSCSKKKYTSIGGMY